ncbi:MAG: CRISPR-associated endoribonuclease Cas6 [Acidobacteria bacterium]|nr:CRISPR-associated endoribonuclease Cas6 [Acidobacteriota bacterium]
MRIKITMQSLSENPSLPLDNYPFASLIYTLIGAADLEAAVFLHDEGIQAIAHDRKRFKPFVFSRLQQVDKRVHAGRQWLAPGPVEWQIGSPIDELILMLMGGLNNNPVVFIGDKQCGAQFMAQTIRIIPPPVFTNSMRFKTLSPIFTALTKTAPDGSRVKYHLRLDDPRFSECIANNLRQKFRALTGETAEDDELSFKFIGNPKSQLVQYDGTNHKCFEGVFEVAGSTRLIHLGWECGFGEANSKGFGMAWAVRENNQYREL